MFYDHEGTGPEIRSLEQNPTETELQMLRCETEQREACSQLRMQIGRLEVEAASRVEQLNKARQIQAKHEGARDSAQQLGAELAHRGSYDQRQQQQTWKRDSVTREPGVTNSNIFSSFSFFHFIFSFFFVLFS